MKVKTYLRVAKNDGGRTPYKVEASARPNNKPLTAGEGRHERVLPTISFAVVLDIDPAAFEQAEQVLAEIEIPTAAINVAAYAEQP